jgi:hypothetical protein
MEYDNHPQRPNVGTSGIRTAQIRNRGEFGSFQTPNPADPCRDEGLAEVK